MVRHGHHVGSPVGACLLPTEKPTEGGSVLGTERGVLAERLSPRNGQEWAARPISQNRVFREESSSR